MDTEPTVAETIIEALKTFIIREDKHIDTSGIFIQDVTQKDEHIYRIIPWSIFTTQMLNMLSKEIHKWQDSILVIGMGQIKDEAGGLHDFVGCKIRSPEYAYMLGIDPETLTLIGGPEESVGRISQPEHSYSHSGKER